MGDKVNVQAEEGTRNAGPLLAGLQGAFGEPQGRAGDQEPRAEAAAQERRPEQPAAARPADQQGAGQAERQGGRQERGEGQKAPATGADMNRLFTRNMATLDGDGDGRVSTAEIDAAVQDPRYKGEDGEMLAVLKARGGDFAGLSNDDTGSERGVSARDMERFHEMQGNVRASAFAQGNFGQMDKDRNGFVSPTELLGAAQSGVGGPEARGHLLNLARHGDSIQAASNDEWGRENSGFSQADLQAWDKQNHRDLVADADGRMDWTRQEMARANRNLYATPGDPTQSIKPDAIRQGSINDCYFLSSLSSLAARDPGAIRDMISSNPDGTHTVTFPGDRANPVTVNDPTDAQLMTYNHGSERGTWASVMESAYNKYVNDHRNLFRTGSDLEGGGAGRNPLLPNHALGLLTGRSVDQDLLSLTTRSTTHDKLSRSVAEGRPATAWITANSLGGPMKAPNESGLPTAHEYAVLGYDPASRTVTIRNPHGDNPFSVGEPVDARGNPRDGRRDGTFQMTLADFYRNFDGVAYAE